MGRATCWNALVSKDFHVTQEEHDLVEGESGQKLKIWFCHHWALELIFLTYKMELILYQLQDECEIQMRLGVGMCPINGNV